MGFVKSATKKSLLGMLKRVDKLTSRDWARLFEGVVFKDELQNYTADGSVTASGISTTTSNFGGILSSADTTVQKALDSIDNIDYDDISDNDGDTDVTGAELEELTDGSDTTLHEHDYTYTTISGNDANTDVTGAELEELSDGSDTTLHGHDVTGLTNWGGPYLPLSADGSYPLTGSLYIDRVSSPGIYLREGGDTSNYFWMYNLSDEETRLQQRRASGDTKISIDAYSVDGTSDQRIYLGAKNATSGSSAVAFYNGATASHRFYSGASDQAELCIQGGTTFVGGVLSVDEIQEFTAAHGVEVDGVLLKDNDVQADEVRTDVIDGKSLGTEIEFKRTLGLPIDTLTAGTTLLTSAYSTVLCDSSGGNVTVSLPAAVAAKDGWVYSIKCIDDTNTVQINPDGTDTIDSVNASITLALDEVVTLHCDGNGGWWII